MTFGRHLLAAAVVAPLLVAGCSEDPKPKIAPPETSPAATSSAPSPEPKEAWERKTRAGAVAFVEHWIEVFNEAQATGDVAALREISSTGCGTCAGVIEQLEDLYGSGGHMETRGWSVVSAVPAEGLPPGQERISMRIARSAQRVLYGDQRPSKTFPASKITMSARLAWMNARWVMDDLVALQ